jgi:hypothetical protein
MSDDKCEKLMKALTPMECQCQVPALCIGPGPGRGVAGLGRAEIVRVGLGPFGFMSYEQGTDFYVITYFFPGNYML